MRANPDTDGGREVPTAGGVPLYPILAVNFVGTLGFSIVLPFLVFLVTRWGGNSVVYGVMGATYSFFQLLGAPLLGRLSDLRGRRRVLLLSQAGTLTSWLIFLAAFALPADPLWSVRSGVLGSFVVTTPLLLMFVARAWDGLTGGNVSVANAYLADVSNDRDRSANFGKMAVAGNLGFILGPAIAGLLGGSEDNALLPVLAALGISAVATILIAVGLPDSRPCVMPADPDRGAVRRLFGQESRPCFRVEGIGRTPLRTILRLPDVPPLLIIYFLVMLGFNFFYIAFPVRAVGALRWTVRDVGIYFSVMSLAMVLVQGPLLARLSRRWSASTLAVGGSFVLATSFVLYLSRRTALLYLGAVLLALGNGLMWPSIQSLLARAAGSRHQGAVQGLAGGSGAVASIAGLLVGGLLYSNVGAGVFLLSAATILIVFLLSLWFRLAPRAAPTTGRQPTGSER